MQIEFIMSQLLELKTEKVAGVPCHASSVSIEPCVNRPLEIRAEEPQWDAAKKGAKPEVTTFDGSLDPKKYMDWEVGLEEYFEWFQLPEDRRI